MDVLDIELNKWPCLILRGKPVTKNQAAEIIIRTQRFQFEADDREFVKELYTAVGIKSKDGYFPDNYSEVRKKIKLYKCLDLNFLQNHQIISSWVGGPYGWCSWNGSIGCSNYNIGKGPSARRVFEEFKLIATEFPYLNFQAQLLSGETCEENLYPLIQYDIKMGKVKVFTPKSKNLIDRPKSLTEGDIVSRLFSKKSERGCTIEQFKKALEITRKKIVPLHIERKI